MKLKRILLLVTLILAIYGCDRDISMMRPHASFSYVPSDTLALFDSVQFINDSKNANSYLWNFGDGTTSTEKDPTHLYNHIGVFSVMLTASDGQYSDTITKIILVNRISTLKPHASFSYLPSDTLALFDSIQFINDSKNANTYLWKFGDGTTSTEKDPTHSYNNVGVFSVMLIASNDQFSDTISYTIVVRIKKEIFVSGYIGYGDLALGALVWENNNCSLLSYKSNSNKATNITYDGKDQIVVGYFGGSYYCKNKKDFVLLNSWEASGTQYLTNTTGIAIKNGNILISGNDCGSAGLWVNGEKQGINTYSDYATGICVSGDDVYISGNSANMRVSFWKNSVKTEIGDGYSNDIAVSKNDVYIVGRSVGKAVYWKNGVLIELQNGIIAKSIMISDQDVYIVGNGISRAICWKNGVASELTYEDYFTEATSIFIDGDDIYVSGIISKTGWDHKAVYWKNGVCNILPFGENNYSSTDIYVK